MNYEAACTILNLSYNFTEKELRKSYLIAALQYHPDKNDSKEATIIFQNITEAYEFLSLELNKNKTNNKNTQNKNNKEEKINNMTYIDLINNLIEIFKGQYKNHDQFNLILECFKNNCTNFSLKILDNLSKDNIIQLYEYIYLYSDILNISNNTLKNIEEIIKNKLKNDSIIILNPTIKNILNNELYKLEFENNIFYVPLWKKETIYDLSGTTLTIKCIPDLENNISIKNNNIHIIINTEINNILKNNISINLDTKVLEIPSEKLYIKKYQTYTFKNNGISEFNNNYELLSIKDIIIHINLI